MEVRHFSASYLGTLNRFSVHIWVYFLQFTWTSSTTINPRPAGGRDRICPPPSRIFAITPKPLQISTRNLRYLILHQFDVDCAIFSEIILKYFATITFLWRHYKPHSVKIVWMLRNSPKIYFKNNAQKASKYVKQQALQNGYSGFSTLWILDPKIFKNQIFQKTYKTKVFGIFKKEEYMLWRPVFAMPMPNVEAIRQFVVTKL